MKINRNLIQLNLLLFPNSLKEEKLKGNWTAGNTSVFFIIELREWPVGKKNNLMNWKDEGKKMTSTLSWYKLTGRVWELCQTITCQTKTEIVWEIYTSCQIAFCSVVE